MNWRQLTTIQIGGAICLPVIMIGQLLAEKFGFYGAVGAVLVGNGVLAVLGVGMALMSMRYRDNTIDNARRFLGERGTQLFGLAFLVVKFGWFAIQLELMGMGVAQILGLSSHWMANLALGAGITGVVLFGIRGIGRLADLCLPLLVGTMVAALYLAGGGAIEGGVAFSKSALSLVIATAIAPLFNLPTFFRHAGKKRDAIWAVLILFLVAVPFVEGMGIYLGVRNPGTNILETLTHAGHPIWNVWIILFLVLAGVTTNNNNLYSSEVAARAIFPRLSRKGVILVLGALGTAASCLPLLSNFTLMLNLMGVGIGATGASILVSYLTGRVRYVGLAGLIGGAVGVATALGGFVVTGAPLLDAVVCGAVTQWLLSLRKACDIRPVPG